MLNFLVPRRRSSSGLQPTGVGCQGVGWASAPGQGLGSPLPRSVLVAGPAVPARLAHGIHSGPQAGHTGLCPTPLLWDLEQDRNSEVPLLQADRLRLCVTKSQQRLCLRAGATALPWALCFSRANHRFCPHDHHPPAAPSSHLLATLTDFGLSSPRIPALGLSPTQDVPWGQESSPQGRLGQQAPLPRAPPLVPYCLPRKGQALHGSTRPSQPTPSGSFSQYSSRPLPEKPPFRWNRGPGTPGPALHLSPSPLSAPSLLLECTSTLSALGPTHASGPSTEGPSAESLGSPATSAHAGTSPRLCYRLQGSFMAMVSLLG